MATCVELKNAGITEGQPFSYIRHQITPDGDIQISGTDIVERITGGGFFGRVIILPQSVVKTTTPDSLHELLRGINWHVPFPSRSNQTAAELDQLSGNILHKTIPVLTGNAVITPDALGYSRLDNGVGFVQHIERMHGRGPRFNSNGDENNKIRDARQILWEVSVKIGTEHVAQVHPKNPFGKPNLWVSETGQIIWLDYLPAFRHTSRVKPMFHFPFHDEVRIAFDSSTPTYNRIHTSRFRSVLAENAACFPPEELEILNELLELYVERWQMYEEWINSDPRELYIADAVDRGLIHEDYAQRLRASDISYQWYQTKELAKLGLRVFLDKVQESPFHIFWDRNFLHNTGKFILNPEYRKQQVLEHTALWGMKQAYDQGLITREEFSSALSFVPEHELRLYVGLQMWYFLNSRLIDALTVPLAAAAATSGCPIEAATAVSAFNILAPGIIRALSTVFVSRISSVELSRAAKISLVPVFGNYFAMPLQLRSVYGEKADDIEHYTIRALIAAISSLRPEGGWNSDLEERLWNAFHSTTDSEK